MALKLQARFVTAAIVLLSLCGPVSGQYLDLSTNLTACFERNEYRACNYALGFSDANITRAQREQVQAKMKAIEAGVAQPRPGPNAQPSGPTSSLSPYDDLEKGFKKATDFVGTVFQIIFGLIALFVVFLLYLKFSRKSAESDAWAKLPVDGPMKVNIQEKYVEAGSFNSKHVPCGLSIDVKISRNDWRVIANAGLMKNVLFHGDGPSGAQYDPENTRPWLVEDLKLPTSACFWDVGRMYNAKEDLLKSLVNLKAAIEAQKEGPQVTEFEL